MARYRPVLAPAVALASLLLVPAAAPAQSVEGGSLAGVVRDSSGGVLAGVTVKATSPVLIERVRTALTDGQGVYRITDLRPGTYALTFHLTGFTVLTLEALQVTTGFTTTADAGLTVGALQEGVTITAQAPLVDSHNVHQQRVLPRDVFNALPLGSSLASITSLIPGATITGTGGSTSQDVGGTKGENTQGFRIHGSRGADYQQLRDGMFFGTLVAPGNYMSSTNPATVQEIVVRTSGQSAESETGGGIVNVVPRDGGNRRNGSLKVALGARRLQASNLTADLQARGLRAAPSIRELYDVGGGFGGPIVRDRLWFFASARYWTSSNYQPNNYYNKLQGSLFYAPDLDRPAYDLNYYQETSGRLTWQATARDKINFTLSAERNCNCLFGIQAGTLAPEATGDDLYWPNWRLQSTWARPVTRRLLLWAGVTVVDGFIARRQTGGSASDISVLEQSTNYRYGSSGSGFGLTTSWGGQDFGQVNGQLAMSYVTGSHALRSGIMIRHGWSRKDSFINRDLSYTFLSQKPASVTYWAGPFAYALQQRATALFAQDQWTMRRLTINAGLRYDALVASAPAQHLPAGTYVPARDFAAVGDIPNWKDISPRFGAAYDMFGNGRSVVKGALGRYVNFESAGGLGALTLANLPVNAMVTGATRTWSDANGDFTPQPEELGPLSDAAFGTTRVTTRYADDVLHGWGVRGYNWQGSVTWEQQVAANASVSVGYFRTSFGNFTAVNNLAVTPEDYDTYCVTAPADARLGTVSAGQVCGLFDIRPAKFGIVNNLVERAATFGRQQDVFNGLDVTVSVRFGRGGVLQGGLSSGAQVVDSCFVVDSPQSLYQCRNEPPWSAATQVKLAVVYPLPWDLQLMANYQNLPPIPTTASLVVPNAQIAPALGRNLGACGDRTVCTSTALVELIRANSYFSEPRNQQLDLRLSRTLRWRGSRIQPQIDVYNAFNASPVLGMTTRYGSQWQFATAALSGRMVKVGLQVYF